MHHRKYVTSGGEATQLHWPISLPIKWAQPCPINVSPWSKMPVLHSNVIGPSRNRVWTLKVICQYHEPRQGAVLWRTLLSMGRAWDPGQVRILPVVSPGSGHRWTQRQSRFQASSEFVKKTFLDTRWIFQIPTWDSKYKASWLVIANNLPNPRGHGFFFVYLPSWDDRHRRTTPSNTMALPELFSGFPRLTTKTKFIPLTQPQIQGLPK